jgi:hypothetical protein
MAGLTPHPMHSRGARGEITRPYAAPMALAMSIVVPLPANGSTTMSPGSV